MSKLVQNGRYLFCPNGSHLAVNALLLDVREPEEIEGLGTIEGYLNIPIDELESRLDKLPRDRTILTA